MGKRSMCLFLAAMLILGLMPGLALESGAVSDMTTSEPCIEILKEMEGFIEKPIYDNGQYSVGYGSACNKDDYPDGITEEEADALLREYLTEMEAVVNRFIRKYKLYLPQNQFDALMLFTYNCGGNWTQSEGIFRSAVISGKTGNDFIYAIALWSSASAQLNLGLVNRRLIEADMYLNGRYTNEKPSNYTYVILNANEGVAEAKVQGYDCNFTAFVKPVPTRTGYRFLGWYSAPEGGAWVRELTSANAEQTLHAHWQEEAGDPVNGIAAFYQISTGEMVSTDVYAAPGGSSVGGLNGDTIATIVADYVDADGNKWGRLYSGGWVKLGDPRIGTIDETAQTAGVEVTVTGDYVNVRSGPGTGYRVVNGVVRGDKLVITEVCTVDNMLWGKFRAGWLALQYTTYAGGIEPSIPDPSEPLPEPEGETPIATGTIAVDQLNIRSIPGSTGYVMGCYQRGDKVNIFERATAEGASWGRTEKGWICLTYVRLDGEETQPTEPETEPTEPETEPAEPETTAPTEPSQPEETTPPTEPPEETTPQEPDTEEPEPETGIMATVISKSGLNIRQGPGTNYPWVASYNSGERIRILEQTLAEGVLWGRTDKGWVSMNYVRLDPGAEDALISGVRGRVTASTLMIRKGPGTGYPVQGTYPRGKEVPILEITKVGSITWGRTNLGWVCMDYIELIQADEDAATPSDPEEDAPEDTQPDAPGQVTGTVISGGGLNIRSEPNTRARIVGYYTRGDKVTLLEQRNVNGILWGRTDMGWICLTYVRLDASEDGTVAAGYDVTVTASTLRIRKTPSTASEVVGSYARGTKITILETQKVGTVTWGRTNLGWVCMDYVK